MKSLEDAQYSCLHHSSCGRVQDIALHVFVCSRIRFRIEEPLQLRCTK